MGGCHAQTNTLLIFDAIAYIFHEAPLLPFFFYLSTPKSPQLALYLLAQQSTWYMRLLVDTHPLGWLPGR